MKHGNNFKPGKDIDDRLTEEVALQEKMLKDKSVSGDVRRKQLKKAMPYLKGVTKGGK